MGQRSEILNLLHKIYDLVIAMRGGTRTPRQILWVRLYYGGLPWAINNAAPM